MKYRVWWLSSLVVALLGLGAFYNFDMQWFDYGTKSWVNYWSHARAPLLGYSYYDAEAIIQIQAEAGFTANNPHDQFGNTHFPLHFPPPLTILFIPFGLMPFTPATLAWLAFVVLLYTSAAVMFNRTFQFPLSENTAIALSLVIPPFIVATWFGNVSGVLGALAVFAWLAQRRGHPALTGVLLVPMLIKPHLIFVAVALLLLESWRRQQFITVATFGGTLIVLSLATFLLDPNWLTGWLNKGLPLDTLTNAPLDVLARALALPEWAPLLGVPLGGGIIFVRHRQTGEITPSLLGEAAILSVLLAPYFWVKDIDILMPAALWMCSRFWLQPKAKWLLLLTLLPVLFVLDPRYWLVRLEDSVVPVAEPGLERSLVLLFVYLFIFIGLWLWAKRPSAHPDQTLPPTEDIHAYG
jgi:hypothetical protein